MRRAPASAEQERLAEWGRSVRRDLPWRHTRDPWAVLVSEVMAQQTPVARVVPHWQRFMSSWPNPAALASADLGDVLAVWKGLGYPRRALWLREAAQVMVARHGGDVPCDLDDLLALKGIGPYTARAVLVFAHEEEVGLVDTNIARVLARRAGRRLTAGQAQSAADDFVRAGAAWEHNQSLMDLGAMLCRPTPRCGGCPLGPGCGYAAGNPGDDPAAGSAGVSRSQARFEGSLRQARGTLLAALGSGPLRRDAVAHVIGTDGPTAAVVVDGLLADGLVVEAGGRIEHAP